MDAARDGLNEARLADDRGEEVAESVVECSTTPRCQHPPSPSSAISLRVVVESTSGSSCSPRGDDSVTEKVDNVGSSWTRPCRSAAQATEDVEATTTTTTATSVPLLEQLVSSPCEVVTPLLASSSTVTSTPAAANDRHEQSGLDNSFLQKLESFVSSVGQVAPASLPHPPLTGWIRRPVFPCRSGVSASAAKRYGPAGIGAYPVSAFFASPCEGESSRPLDLSSKRMESPTAVDSARSSQQRRVDVKQHGGDSGVDGRFVDVSELQPSGASTLACLERDFGEHSTILTRLGSCRDRQRQTAELTGRSGGASRRGRSAVIPGLTSAGARVCPPRTIVAPRAEPFHPPRSFIGGSRQQPPTSNRTCVVGGKNDSRQPMMTAATALRCLQCGGTFFSLPELTLHMIQSAHYANLICAAAAYSVVDDDDDDDCIVVDSYNSRQSSNVGVDHSTRRPGPLQLSRGKDAAEVTNVRGGDRLCRSGSDARRADYLDAAVSPAQSLDDESVSSAGLTETESLQSTTSSGSPTSPSYENVAGGGDDDLTLMSHLLRLQPLLSRTVLDNRQAGAAAAGHADWTAAGLAAVDQRRRQPDRGRPSKTSLRDMDRSSTANSLPMDLRSQRADGSLYTDDHSGEMPGLTTIAKPRAFTSRPSTTAYLEKLLDDVREYRKSFSAGVKRSASSKWFNGKHRTKKHQSYFSSHGCNQTRSDRPRLNGDRSVVVSAAPTVGEAHLRKRDDGIHGRDEIASGVKMSPPEKHCSRRQETADGARRSSPKNVAVQPAVVDGGDTADSPAQSVRGRDGDASSAAAGRDFRRSGVDKDQSEYEVRFGKYYRLARELSNRTD